MNLIWIISDTFRRDYFGAYGNKTIHTPSLDSLAAKSVRFDNHYMAAFPTMPARADFFTGRWTMSYMQWEALPKTETVLPEILSDAGFKTAGIVDTPFYVRLGMCYDRGFQTFIEIPGQFHHAGTGAGREAAHPETVPWRYESDRYAPQTFISAMQWLQYNYKDNFFLCIDTWDPHEPWNAPSYYTELYMPDYDGEVVPPVYGRWQDFPGYTEERLQKAVAAYSGEVTMVDTWVGNLLKQIEYMGLMDNTAIIFTTDHGFYFGEHGGYFGKMAFAKDPETGEEIQGVWSHSPFYQEISRIPLTIYIPGIKPGVYDGLTSAVDLMPTILDIMEQNIPGTVQGHSLLPAMNDQSLPGRKYVISAHPFVNAGDYVKSIDDMKRKTVLDSASTVTTDDWALIYDVEPGFSELYNMKTDPGQKNNIIDQYPDKARELHQLQVEFMRETGVPDKILKSRLELRL